MGNLKLNIKGLKAVKLDPNDPKVKAIIESAIKQQEKMLALKFVSRESLRAEITI